MIKIGYIYKITNPNGGIYIGKSLRLKDRISKLHALNFNWKYKYE
jgi:hypothetical protein